MKFSKLVSSTIVDPKLYKEKAIDSYEQILTQSFLAYNPSKQDLGQLYADALQRSRIAGWDVRSQIDGCCSILKVKDVLSLDGLYEVSLNDIEDQRRLCLKFYYSKEDCDFFRRKNTPYIWHGDNYGISIANDILYSGMNRWEAFKNCNILLANYLLLNDGLSCKICESPKLYVIPENPKPGFVFFQKLILKTQLYILAQFIDKPRIADITYNGYQNANTDRYMIEAFNEIKSRYEERFEEVKSTIKTILH